MTREEALQILDTIPTIGEQVDALEMAIQALSQEPCDDAISRKEALKCINDIWGDYFILNELFERIDKLPSVTQKSGKWIMSDDGLYRPICDKCGAHPWKGYIPTVEEATEVFKYCPNCGAKMESETETWNGMHGQITAPKGTFKKIYEDAESGE